MPAPYVASGTVRAGGHRQGKVHEGGLFGAPDWCYQLARRSRFDALKSFGVNDFHSSSPLDLSCSMCDVFVRCLGLALVLNTLAC